MKILCYRVEISDGRGIISRPENEFKVTELNVIGENRVNLVVDDLHFTTIRKEKSKYMSPCLGHPEISLTSNDSVWGSRITYTLYTVSRKRAATIRKEIEKKVRERFGFFINGLTLDVIRDGVGVVKGGAEALNVSEALGPSAGADIPGAGDECKESTSRAAGAASDEPCQFCGKQGDDVCDTPPADLCPKLGEDGP